MVLPLMNSVPGCSSAIIACATSSGRVARAKGFFATAAYSMLRAPGIFESAGVSVTPARMALQVMPRGPSSMASWRMYDSSAALAPDTAP